MAAGLGFKTFNTGDVLTAADTNGYLMQGVWVFADAAERTTAVTSPQEGNMSYLKDTNSLEYYSGSAWTAVASTGSNWALLNAGGTNLTGATTITVSSISGKDKILVLIEGASAGASNTLKIRFNGTTSTDYYQYGADLLYVSTYDGSNMTQTNANLDGITFAVLSNNGSSKASGYVLLSGCNTSGVKVFNSIGAASTEGGNSQTHRYLGGFFNSSATISSVSIVSSGSNLDAGKIYVYASA